LICLSANYFFFAQPSRQWIKILEVLVTIATAAAVFFGAAYALGVSEVGEAIGIIGRRLGRKR